MSKMYNKEITRKNQTKNNERSKVKTSQAKLKQKNLQTPFNVFAQTNKVSKKQQINTEGNQEYYTRKIGRNEQRNTLNQLQKNKMRLRTESAQYDRLHEKLESIETRISQMKQNLQKKRQEKDKRQKLKQKLDEQRRKASYSNQKGRSKKKGKIQNKKDSKEIRKGQQGDQQKQVKQNSKDLNNFITQQKSKVGNSNQNLKTFVTQVPQSNAHTFNNNPYSPRSNIYYVSEIIKAYRDENSLAREHIKTSFELLRAFQNVKLPSKDVVAKKAVILPRRRGYQDKKTVIFDLDETLIHCNENLQMSYQVKLPIKFPTGDIIEAGINIRPGAETILKNLNKNFQVIVFTASHPCYANVVIDYLDPTGQLVHHRLFREHCYLMNNGPYVKDLRIIDRDPSKMVLVDNAAYSYVFQLDNGIPIIPYYNGSQDFELKALQTYLQKFLFVDDVRTVNRNTFKLRQYQQNLNCEEVVQNLYLN